MSSRGGAKEEYDVSNEDDIYLFLQRNEIGLSPEEAKKTSDALGRPPTLSSPHIYPSPDPRVVHR